MIVVQPEVSLVNEEVSEERTLQLAKAVDVFIACFETSEQQNLAISRLSMPLN